MAGHHKGSCSLLKRTLHTLYVTTLFFKHLSCRNYILLRFVWIILGAVSSQARFSSVLSCPTHSFTVLVHSYFFFFILQSFHSQQEAVFKNPLYTTCSAPKRRQTVNGKLVISAEHLAAKGPDHMESWSMEFFFQLLTSIG